MAWEITNNWIDIVDLRVDDSVTNSSFEVETEFRVELYADNYELNLEERRVLVGFSRITLQIVCHGTEIAMGERYGDNTPENSINTKTTLQGNTELGGKIAGGVNLDPATVLSGMPIKFSASGEASSTASLSTETVKNVSNRHVTAKPNGKWEISSLERRGPLSAKFLTTEHVLCRIKPKANSNRTGVQAHVYAHKHDLVVTSDDEKKSLLSLTNSENRNKEKIFKILLGKAMTNEREGLDRKNYVQLSSISSLSSDD